MQKRLHIEVKTKVGSRSLKVERPSYTRLSGRLPRGAGSSPAGTTNFGVSMKAIIETKFYVRDRPHSGYYSFPTYSDEIEKTLIRNLDFLERHGTEYSLSLTIEGNKK